MAIVAAMAIACWVIVEAIRADGPAVYILVVVPFLFAGGTTFVVTLIQMGLDAEKGRSARRDTSGRSDHLRF
jgi:hypothetical protein